MDRRQNQRQQEGPEKANMPEPDKYAQPGNKTGSKREDPGQPPVGPPKKPEQKGQKSNVGSLCKIKGRDGKNPQQSGEEPRQKTPNPFTATHFKFFLAISLPESRQNGASCQRPLFLQQLPTLIQNHGLGLFKFELLFLPASPNGHGLVAANLGAFTAHGIYLRQLHRLAS